MQVITKDKALEIVDFLFTYMDTEWSCAQDAKFTAEAMVEKGCFDTVPYEKKDDSICTCCGIKKGDSVMLYPIVPSDLWLETSKRENGLVQMKFGVGDDAEHIYYFPKYCPECGRKIEIDNGKQKND